MILEHTGAFATKFEDIQLEASSEFVGDSVELAEMAVEAMSEQHNLTLAMARFEHKCLVENDQSLMEGAVGEFFKKAAENIKKWWNKFIAWLGSMWTAIKDFFIKREDWLKRNAAAIGEKTDEELGKVKVKIGANVLDYPYDGAASALIGAGNAAIAAAAAVTPDKEQGFFSSLKERFLKAVKAKMEDSAAKAMRDVVVGAESEVALSKSMVTKAIAAAHASFKCVDQLKGAKAVAEAALKHAEGMARIDNAGDKEATNSKLKALQAAGPAIQTAVGAYSSAVGAANGQLMSLLAKAAAVKGAKEEKKPEAAAAAPQNESGSLLAQFM